MICGTCGLATPERLPHTNMDHCFMAMEAAQEAVRLIIQYQLEAVEKAKARKEQGNGEQ